jgi:transcriptional regulator with XRE-family HTH domain
MYETRINPRLHHRELHPVRAYRARHDLSMGQFGQRCGLSEGALSRIESGQLNPSAVVILKLAIATEGEVSEFDIWRYHAAVQTGVVPPFRAPSTSNYHWNWVRPADSGSLGSEPATAAA